MGKKNSSGCCLDLPLHDIVQKVYDLGPNFCISLIEMRIEEPRLLQLHLKLIERETTRHICFDKVILLDLFRQLNQFESADIEYPCCNSRDIGLSVKSTTTPGEYQIVFEKIKLILDSIAVNRLLNIERRLLSDIRDIENTHHRRSYDVVG